MDGKTSAHNVPIAIMLEMPISPLIAPIFWPAKYAKGPPMKAKKAANIYFCRSQLIL